MIGRTMSLYKNAYSGLTASTWLLSLVMLINRSGTMVNLFMPVYLTYKLGYSVGKSGIVMALFGAGAVAGAYIGGRLTDRIGFFSVQIMALIGGGILFVALGLVKTFPLICLFTFLLSLVNESFRPANSTAIVAYSREDNRTRSYALNRLAVNLGWAVGSTTGGILASIDYNLLFWVDGLTNIFAAFLLWISLRGAARAKNIEKKKEEVVIDKSHSPYRDKIYLWFLLLTIIFAACFFQFLTNTNVYYKLELHFDESFIGVLGAVNGVMIVVIEMVLVFKLEGKRSNMYYIIRGVALVGVSYIMLNVLHITMAMGVLVMVVMTMGEILALPFMNTYWIGRSKNHNRGQYAGAYTISWSVAQTLGPLIGAQVAQYAGFSTLWWFGGATCFLASVGFAILQKKENTSVP